MYGEIFEKIAKDISKSMWQTVIRIALIVGAICLLIGIGIGLLF